MVKDNILKYMELKGIRKSDFLAKTGIKRGFLDTDKTHFGAKEGEIGKILVSYPDLSPEWLILGKGDMCKPITSTQNQANQANDDNTLERLIRTQAETIETQRKLIETQDRLLELLKKE